MLWVLLIAFFSAGLSSKMPPDFPFIGTETSDFRKKREKDWTSGQSEEGGRTVSWEPWAESGLLNFTLERIHNCFQFKMGVTQITVPPSAKTQSTACTTPPQAQPSPRSREPKPWHHHHQWLSLRLPRTPVYSFFFSDVIYHKPIFQDCDASFHSLSLVSFSLSRLCFQSDVVCVDLLLFFIVVCCQAVKTWWQAWEVQRAAVVNWCRGERACEFYQFKQHL